MSHTVTLTLQRHYYCYHTTAYCRTASASINVALRAGSQRANDITVQNTQVQNFSPLHALRKLDSYLSNVLQRSQTVQNIRPYMVATRAWWPGGEQPGGYTDIVLARGIEIDAQLTTFAWLRSAGGVILICILDYITLLLATFLFLTPLEAMGKRIRNGQQVDIAYLKSLTKRRWCMIIVAAAGVCSLLVAIWVRADGKHTMEQAVEARSRNNCGTIKMSYRLVALIAPLLLLPPIAASNSTVASV
jgi:hypothetical protein